MKKIFKGFGIFLLILLLLFLGLGFFLRPSHEVPVFSINSIADSTYIEYPGRYNFRQSFNDCGPYNVAAVVRALTKKEVSSAAFAESIPWRMSNDYTFPWGVEQQLKDNGLFIEIPNLWVLSDSNKVHLIQERLTTGRPIIILGQKDSIQHYVTLFGYHRQKDEFYAYDSLWGEEGAALTPDDNGAWPGNRSFSSKELLDFWKGGGMYGQFVWYSIVVGTQEDTRHHQ